MKKMLFVYNPHSGKGLLKNSLNAILDIFTKADYLVTVYPTQKARDGYERVLAWWKDFDLIVCSGGDGTLNEVIAARRSVEGEFPPIGYIPTGTTNDFAGSLGIPKDLIKAAKLVTLENIAKVDVGEFNGRSFNYVAAFGLLTDTSYKTSQSAKNLLGHQAYVLEGFRSIQEAKNYRLRAFDACHEIEGTFIYGMVTNTITVGGFSGLTGKEVSLTDGVFEVVLVRAPSTPAELHEIVQAIIWEKEDPLIVRFTTSEITFDSVEPIAWSLDGEEGGEHTKTTIRVIPQAVTLCVGDPVHTVEEA